MLLQLYTKLEIYSFAVRRLIGDRRAVTALEYGIIAAVMGSLIVTAFTTLGNSMHTAYTSIGTVMTTKAASM